MAHNQVRVLLSNVDGHTEWFRLRNISKWIHKFWKPAIDGMYVGKYEGEWKDGKMHGTGTLRISRICSRFMSFGWRLIDQGKYEGEWKNGKEHGKGIRFYRSGLQNYESGKYEGEWKDGKYHGHGTRSWSWKWKNGKRHVDGGLFWDAQKYVGEWKNGLEHGQGTRTWLDGRKFIGEWKKGKYIHGTYYFPNGDKHVGFFKEGVAKGQGTRTYADGRIYTGEFKCREKKLSEGTCFYTGRKKVSKFIESIPAGFDKNENYIGFIYDKYKKEKPTKNKPSFIYKLIQKIELKQRPLSTT